MSKLDDLRKKYGGTETSTSTTSGGSNKLDQLRQKYAQPTASYQHSLSPSVKQDTGLQGQRPPSYQHSVADPVRQEMGIQGATMPKYKQITQSDVETKYAQDVKEHQEKIRAVENQQAMTGKQFGILSSGTEFAQGLSKQKQELLKTKPTPEQAKKKLYAEQGRQMIKDDVANETGWMQFLANTLDPVSFQQYQTNPEYQKVVKAGYLPEIEQEKLLEKTKADINARYPNLDDGMVKDTLVALSNWWLETKATGNTLAGLYGQGLSIAQADPTDAMAQAALSKDVTFGQAMESQINLREDARKGAQSLIDRGGEQFLQAGLEREAFVGDDALRGFMFDVTKVVPDMLTTVALASMTGGAGATAKMGGKEIAKGLLKKETRSAALKAIAAKMVVSPETVPLGAKIFAQSYQTNLDEGMEDGQAFLTAFINAYGQSLLEGGGVNKAFKEGGLDKAVDFVKASMGEGFEEIPQNWWEGAVSKFVGGKDIPVYSGDPNQESIINPARDVYSAAVGSVAGGVGASVKVPGAVKAYVDTKTKPKVTYQDPRPKLEQYDGDMKKYETDLAAYETRQNAPEVKAETKPLTYTQQVEKAREMAPELLRQEISYLEEQSLATEGMPDEETWNHYNELQEMAADLTEDDIVAWVVNKEAPKRIVDALGTAKADGTIKLDGVKIDEKAPEPPTAPNLGPKVDTSKMNKKVLSRMESQAQAVSEQAQTIEQMAMQGATVKEISQAIGADVKPYMTLNGIPTNPSARGMWTATKGVGESVVREMELKADRTAPTLSTEEAQSKMQSIPVLKDAVVATDLNIGHTYVQKLGKKLGVDVVFYEGGPAMAEGLYSAKEGRTVFINRKDAETGQATMRIVGHEFLHSVRNNHGELYKTLREVVGDTMTTDKVSKLLDRYKLDPEYQSKLAEDQETLIEEMLADEAGSLFTDKEFWNRVYEKDATVAQKLVKLLRDLINRILGEKSESGNIGIMTELQVKDFQKKFEDAVAEIMKDSYSGTIKENFDVTNKEAMIGEEALKDLNEKYSLRGAGRDSNLRKARTIARDYTKKFLSEGQAPILGQKIKNTQELAVLAQIYRDPRYETLRYIFTDDSGSIVYTTGVTCRLPGVASTFVGKDMSKFVNTEFNAAKKQGATGYYLLHNHPSGDPNPSQEDINMTRHFARVINDLTMRGHVIVNSKKYATIDDFGAVGIYGLNVEDNLLVPDKPHSALGVKVSSPDALSQLGKQVQAPSGYSVLFYMSPQNVVRGIQEIPSEMVSDPARIKKFLKTNALNFGGANAILVAEDTNVYQKSKELVETSYVLDVLHATDLTTLRNEGVSPISSEGKYMGKSLEGQEVKFSTRKDLSPYRYVLTNVRGGWTIEKIEKDLKRIGSSRMFKKSIAEYDTIEEFADNMYWHGTGGFIGEVLKAGSAIPKNAFRSGGYDDIYHTISLSKSKNAASNFTGDRSSGTVYPVVLRKDANVIERPDLTDSVELEDILVELWEQGVDAVKLGDWSKEFSEQELAVLNPRAIAFDRKRGETFSVYKKKKFENPTFKELKPLYDDAKAVAEKLKYMDEVKYSTRKESIEKAFKDSKVRGKDGKLLPVYHGTGSDFTVFDKSKLGSYTVANSAKLGFFFTDNSAMADTYRSGEYDMAPVVEFFEGLSDKQFEDVMDELGYLDGPHVGDPDFVPNDWDRISRPRTIENALANISNFDKMEGTDDFDYFIKQMKRYGFDRLPGFEKVLATKEKGYGKTMELYLNITNPLDIGFTEVFDEDFYTKNIEKAKEVGHDGVIFRDVQDAVTAFDEKNGPTGDVYVAFEPNQIKSPEGELEVDIENNDIRFKIKAYHGTPHDFDKFSTEAIGTGEGAQAYGWGLYFAGSKGIAEWYRDTLSAGGRLGLVALRGEEEINLKQLARKIGGNPYDALNMFAKRKKDPTLKDLIEYFEDELDDVSSNREKYTTTSYPKEKIDSEIKELESFLNEIKSMDSLKPSKGRLYEVDLAPDEEHMLDWFEPIKNQSPYVREILLDAFSNEKAKENYSNAVTTFTAYDRMLLDKYGEDYNELRTDAEEEEYVRLASELKNARLLSKMFGDSESTTGERLYKQISLFYGQKEASMLLNSLGIPGIKYLDGTSRSKGDGKYNYVVFDDTAVEVMDKYSVKKQPTGVPSVEIVLDEKKEPVNLPGRLKDLYRRVVDTNSPISRTDAKAARLASNAALVSGTIEWIAERELVDTNGDTVGKSLKETVKPFADNKDFWKYMAQRHNIDRAREGTHVDPDMSPDHSKAYVKEVEKQHPEYKAWADSVTAWIDTFMQKWAVATGIIDSDVYADWRKMYPSYFPTYREFSELEKDAQMGPGKRFVDLPSPVRKATGSGRNITNPVGNIIQMMNKVVRTARYNEVGKALYETVQSDPEKAQKYAEIIPPSIGMFNKLDNVVTVWVDGQPQYLQINDKTLLESLNGMPRIINNAAAVRKVTKVYKGLITQYNPMFALRNIFRDVPTAYVYGSQHNPFFFLGNLAKAGYQVATKTGGARQYMALGGGGSGQFSADSAAKYAKLLQPSATKNPLIRGAKGALKAIEFLNNVTEQAPRVSEFNHVLKKTGSVEKALFAAQNVTVNFARGGDVAKQIEPFVPYFNASVQGLDRFFQAFNFKKDPKGALLRMAKAGVLVTAPQLVSYMMSVADDEEKYKQLDQRTKDSYYVFPKGDGTYWKIPKSRELGVLFASLFERALTGNFEGFAGTVATNFTPVDPFTNNLAAPLVFNLPMNKDFAGRAIVPQYMQNDGRSPALQYDDNTSEIAKKIGEMTNLSPKQIDYLIRSYTGMIGQFLLPATTERSGAGNAFERMTIGAFTADPAFSSQPVTDFYNKLGELQTAKTDKNIKEGVPSKVVTPEERMYNAMNNIASNVSKTTKYINANLKANDPKVKELRELVNSFVVKANKAKTVADLIRLNAEMKATLYGKGVR